MTQARIAVLRAESDLADTLVRAARIVADEAGWVDVNASEREKRLAASYAEACEAAWRLRVEEARSKRARLIGAINSYEAVAA